MEGKNYRRQYFRKHEHFYAHKIPCSTSGRQAQCSWQLFKYVEGINRPLERTCSQNESAVKYNDAIQILQVFNMIQGESGNEENIPLVSPQVNTVQHPPPELMKILSELETKVK